MGDVLKFPGQWHGPDNEPGSTNENAPIAEVSPVNLATMLEYIKIYMPDEQEKEEQEKIFGDIMHRFLDNEIMLRIKSSGTANWAKDPVFYHCLYQEAKKRGLIQEPEESV